VGGAGAGAGVVAETGGAKTGCAAGGATDPAAGDAAGAGAAAGGGVTATSVRTGVTGRGGATINAAMRAFPMRCCRPRLIFARATVSGAVAEMPTKLAARASEGRPFAGGRSAP
jgi:hypothetical protein